ncbi:MAG: DNA/RNA non-specific endonuclease [Acidobacteria bacterium]|nr:DNA/RNA non-specific endonuclease [Acidobacteriota bacterium]
MASKKKSAKPKAKKSADFMEQLKQFVRTRGEDFLKDKNISSVGIGYKEKDGKKTKVISVQFTVEKKASTDLLESLDTREIPKSFNIGGVEVPTDVLERSYKLGYKLVAEAEVESVSRKTRIDPIRPGVSVANKKVSAGTIGCIVYDKVDGTPYVLSNWHVLNGPEGQIGDDVVQPGPFDDNRTAQNRLGKLVRSHLGAAGDCAIASIEDRRFEPEILDLAVKVESIGEPELDDKVIKSGRTTAVTHGIVSRIHTMTRIDYGGSVGEKAIGGFEIEVDPANPPSNGEVSMGGDSGSVWLFKTNQGKPGKVMAGLHFAGEGAGNPHEHAIACYAKSVFDKLEISTKAEVVMPPAPGRGDSTALGRGYNSNFLATRVELPKLSTARLNDAVKSGNSELIHHTHFTLVQSKSRRFAIYVAWNIDGGRMKRISRSDRFVLDPLVPSQFQVGDSLYSSNRLDRGHIARRADLTWGTDAEARRASDDSFFFTNITPQMDNFNQSGLGGIWGKIEDAVFEEVDVADLKVSVFGGPIFRDDDRVFRGVKIPREFFKVLAYVENGKLEARAFLLAQSLNELEVLDLNQFRVFQVALSEVESRCGFKFPANLKAGDTFAERIERMAETAERPALESLADIKW